MCTSSLHGPPSWPILDAGLASLVFFSKLECTSWNIFVTIVRDTWIVENLSLR